MTAERIYHLVATKGDRWRNGTRSANYLSTEQIYRIESSLRVCGCPGWNLQRFSKDGTEFYFRRDKVSLGGYLLGADVSGGDGQRFVPEPLEYATPTNYGDDPIEHQDRGTAPEKDLPGEITVREEMPDRDDDRHEYKVRIADLLGQYLKDIHHAVLTREQERNLAHRIADGDRDAVHELVRHNLRLIVFFAKRATERADVLQELIRVGEDTLYAIAEKFDPDRGRFSTYARICLYGAFQEYFRKEKRQRMLEELVAEQDRQQPPWERDNTPQAPESDLPLLLPALLERIGLGSEQVTDDDNYWFPIFEKVESVAPLNKSAALHQLGVDRSKYYRRLKKVRKRACDLDYESARRYLHT